MSMNFEDQVAIVTGAGRGLGRAHALALAERGAKVVVNELNEDDTAEAIAAIEAAGGEALGFGANVAEPEQVEAMVAATMERWGRVDILVNNAGLLRDKTFAKMSMEDFRLVVDVHLMGSVYCTKAVWEIMREQQYGRVIFTTSSSGLYGNFGQSNYGAAKMGLVGLMNTLHLEGQKHDIRVNCFAPAAGTAMTDGLIPQEMFELLTPETASPAVVFLASTEAPSRTILCAGGGSFAIHNGFETVGVNLLPDQVSADGIYAAWDKIAELGDMQELTFGYQQAGKYARQASEKLDLKN